MDALHRILADVEAFARWRGGKLTYADYEIYKARIKQLNLGEKEREALKILAKTMNL